MAFLFFSYHNDARSNKHQIIEFHCVCKHYLKKNSDKEWAIVQICSERTSIKFNDLSTTAKYGVWKCVDWDLDYIFQLLFFSFIVLDVVHSCDKNRH